MSYDLPSYPQPDGERVWTHREARVIAAHLGIEVSALRDMEAKAAQKRTLIKSASASVARNGVKP